MLLDAKGGSAYLSALKIIVSRNEAGASLSPLGDKDKVANQTHLRPIV